MGVAYFVLYIMAVTYLLLNLFTGVIVEVMLQIKIEVRTRTDRPTYLRRACAYACMGVCSSVVRTTYECMYVRSRRAPAHLDCIRTVV